MKRIIAPGLLLFTHGLVGCAPEEGLEGIERATSALTPRVNNITVEATSNENELRVSWQDYADETGYSIYRSTSANPPSSPLAEGLNPAPTWSLVARLSANRTTLTDFTFGPTTYAVCAEDNLAQGGTITHCTLSARVAPLNIIEAAVNNLRVGGVSTSSISVQWINSFSVVRSRVSISPGSSAPIVNDADQSVTFNGLQANVMHRVTVCVASQDQVDRGLETCDSVSVRTLVLAPLAVGAIDVVSSSSPTSRTVGFRYNNQQSNAAAGIMVRILRGDSVVRYETVYPTSFTERRYDVSFSGLAPFTDYEAWVIPYNAAGIGRSAGAAFTTPAQVTLSPPVALSANSALLSFHAPAVGSYAIEYGSREVGRIQVLSPATQQVVLQNLPASQQLRVVWRLAHLRSESNVVTATQLAAGAPEFQSLSSLQLATRRLSAVVLPTVSGPGPYVLQGLSPSGGTWSNLGSAGSSSTSVTAGIPLTVNGETTLQHAAFRVCRNAGALVCSAPSTAALTRDLRRF